MLTDRQRLGVLLQAVAVLGHLAHGGWRLKRGWSDARVTPDGLLTLRGVEPGQPTELLQNRLRTLLSGLFACHQAISGRGEARRAARSLLKRWCQTLSPLSADDAIGQLLETAPFLWEPTFAAARRALVGEHHRAGRIQVWVVAPGRCRSHLLAAARNRQALEQILSADDARRIWDGAIDGADPVSLAAAGRWRAAVAGWERRPPQSSPEALNLARALCALGRFERALDTLRGRSGNAARLLRISCQYQLGRLNAARASLRRLESRPLSGRETVELAETAVRVLANRGERQAVADWIGRVLAAGRGQMRLRAELIAAAACWDLGDLERMGRLLEAAEAAVEDPDLAWRYHQARGLQAGSQGDSVRVVEHFTRALASSRRYLLPIQAGRLWSDLAMGRVQAGDLAGAERASSHAAYLLRDCDGPIRITLALYNLAEVRLRRGRLLGVEEILESSEAENRLSGNLRGSVEDSELRIRLLLVQGRLQAAVALCRQTLELLDAERVNWHRAELHVLRARALGWLGRREDAARELSNSTPKAITQLEPEERPAVWALAGETETALEASPDSPLGRLWTELIRGRAPPADAWHSLRQLESFRSARMVLDLELFRTGSVPATWTRQAIATFRRLGVGYFAERLEGQSRPAWRALEGYLLQAQSGPQGLAELFAACGYPQVNLAWEAEDRQEQILAGEGGDQELCAPLAGGSLVLRAPVVDEVVRTLFALAVREFVPGRRAVLGLTAIGGIVGESPALRAALERAERVAPGDLPVVIVGETGTGKELVARHIHRRSARSQAAFLPINCAALSETLLLSDLFGHIRGAFTSADRDRVGVFESARGGTVFLDEIGDLPLSAQGMLLRVLQEGEMRRVGESLPRHVDVRVLTATHRDLAALVDQGSFRQDLFYRLKVAEIRLPPLRDRGHDVILVAEHLLRRDRSSPPRLAPEACSRLLAYSWPGNIRELENVLEVAVALGDGNVIRPEHLDLPETVEGVTIGYHEQVEDFRRRLVRRALNACGGNRAEAARRLGLSRQALSYLVRQLGIH